MGVRSTPTDIGHCIAWMCLDYARLITGCDFVVDGGARAKYWAYTPPEGNAGPVPLVRLEDGAPTPAPTLPSPARGEGSSPAPTLPSPATGGREL